MEVGTREPGATVLRAGTTADAEAIAALLGDLGYPTDPGSAEARIARVSGSAGTAVIVAEREGVVCGLATVQCIPLFHGDGQLARITSIVVARSMRRTGVGSALLAACEAFALAHGAERLELTSGDRRLDAHAFYEHSGFEREGVRMTRWVVQAGARS